MMDLAMKPDPALQVDSDTAFYFVNILKIILVPLGMKLSPYGSGACQIDDGTNLNIFCKNLTAANQC